MLRDPGNVMASFVLAQIDTAVNLFTSLLQHGARTPRYKRNLQWLINLRSRALSKVSQASTAQRGDPQRDAGPEWQGKGGNGDGDGHREHEEDVELLGWRTRLIERAGQGREKTVRTIRRAETSNESPTNSHTTETTNPPLNEINPMPAGAFPTASLDSTNEIVR